MMSTKRSLYKPAKSGNIKKEKPRHGLIQGRLASSTTLHPSSPLNGTIDTSVDPRRSTMPATPSRLHSSLISDVESSPRLSLHAQQKTSHYDPVASPRSNRSRVDRQVIRPSVSLDISDVENDHQKVEVVDASDVQLNPSQSEVVCDIEYHQSPAKVICHSPRSVHSKLRSTGDVDSSRRVELDEAPVSVSVMGPQIGDIPTVDLYRDTSGAQTEDLYRVKAGTQTEESKFIDHSIELEDGDNIVKSVLDRMSPKLEAFNNLRKQHHRSGSFLDDNHEAAQRSAAQRSGSFLDDNHEAAQRSAAHRSGEKPRVLSKTAPKIQGNKSVQKGGAPQLKKTLMPPRPPSMKQKIGQSKKVVESKAVPKKKAPGKVVASRYLNVSNPGPKKVKSNAKTNVGNLSEYSATKSHHATPDLKSRHQVVSTPTTDNVPSPNLADLSAIPHNHTNPHHDTLHNSRHHRTQDTSHSSRHQRTQDTSHSSRHQRKQDTSSNTSHKTPDEQHITQTELDLHYFRYLQWIYMEKLLEKQHKEQEENVMSQLYAMWELVEEKHSELAELQRKVQAITAANEVDDLLDSQESLLDKIFDHLPQLRDQLSLLTESLDATRHQISTKNVHIPEQETEYVGAIQRGLSESEALLGTLSAMCRPQQENLADVSNALQQISTTTMKHIETLDVTGELVAACNDLTLEETALTIMQEQAGQ